MPSGFVLRMVILALVMIAVYSTVSWKLVQLQFVQHKDLEKEVTSRHVSRIALPAQRGTIFDRNDTMVAADKPVRNVKVDLVHLRHKPYCREAIALKEGRTVQEMALAYRSEELQLAYRHYVASFLSVPLGIPEADILAKLESKRSGEIVLAKGLEEDVGAQLEQWLAENKIRGVYCTKEMTRSYTTNRANHVVGFVNHERVGREGVEGSMDEILAGRSGHRFVVRDGQGNEIPSERGEFVEPRHGQSVRLTIDLKIQGYTEDALDAVMARVSPKKAMAVVMRASTGEVLAMASRPGYNRFSMKGNRRNESISAVFEPGSTFKIVPIGGAIEQRLVSLNTRVFCHQGRYSEPGIVLTDSHPYGELSVGEVVMHSSNIGTFKVSRQLGKNLLHEYMMGFGFGSKTGIELTGEVSGIVHPPSRWNRTSISRVGMGYEVSVTTLQSAVAMSAVANGGLLLKPTIVSALLDNDGNVISESEPELIGRPLGQHATESLRRALAGAASEEGTGRLAQIDGWTVAGKTGTARRYCEELEDYEPGSYVTSFSGYAPQENPDLVCVVVVDDPQNDRRYGGSVAAPVFSEIVGQSLNYLSVHEPTRRLVQADQIFDRTSHNRIASSSTSATTSR